MNKADATILIVEDDELLLLSLSNNLKQHYFQVLQARNGKQGLSQAFKLHPDLIILDVLMPIINGIEMIEKLRSDTWGKTVPILVLTNLEFTDPMLSVLANCEPIQYVKKLPLNLDHLIQSLQSALQ